ncbi:MAG: transcriptional repressor [Anaerolineales bacterium]|nr:transcriptional repressor [Anaerolineales bacterium]
MSQTDEILDTLRQRGYRITAQREIVVEIISEAEHHLSAEEIYQELETRTPGANISTVYRTLEVLWEEGLTCRNDLSEGKIVYATREHGPHIHLVCRRCNYVIEAEPEVLNQLSEVLLANYQFRADLDHLSIFGLCEQCEDDPRVEDPHNKQSQSTRR